MSTARHQLAGAPGTGTTIDNMASRAKNWVRINAATPGSVSVVSSFNMSSATDVSVGANSVNLTSAMANTNFIASGHAMQIGVSWGGIGVNSYTTSAYQLCSFIAWGSAGADINNSNAVVHGDLA